MKWAYYQENCAGYKNSLNWVTTEKILRILYCSKDIIEVWKVFQVSSTLSKQSWLYLKYDFLTIALIFWTTITFQVFKKFS